MSTQRTPLVKFTADRYDNSGWGPVGVETRHGRVLIQNTSDTVAWEVDGKTVFVFSREEFAALVKCIDTINRSDL